MKEYNLPGIFVVIFYPILLISLGVCYINNFGIGWFEAILFLCGYYITNITIGIGMHRLWSHDTYKVNKYVELILVILAAGSLQGPSLSWASNHFKHHAHTDEEEDPHSPLKYKSKIKGFLWSHMGWMLMGEGSYKSIDRVTMVKLGRNKLLRWQLKHYWILATSMNTVVPALVGFIFGGTFLAAYAGFLFIGLGRALQHHMTFCTNSLCHFIGEQKYIKGTSRDIWWLAPFLLGENWHNYHHAFASDYRNGAKWYHFDVHKWIIYLMSLCGLASDLKKTAQVRVEAKVTQTMESFIESRKKELESLYDKASDLVLAIQGKVSEIEETKVGFKVKRSLLSLNSNLNMIIQQLGEHLKNFDNSSEKIINILSKKLKKIEHSWHKLYPNHR